MQSLSKENFLATQIDLNWGNSYDLIFSLAAIALQKCHSPNIGQGFVIRMATVGQSTPKPGFLINHSRNHPLLLSQKLWQHRVFLKVIKAHKVWLTNTAKTELFHNQKNPFTFNEICIGLSNFSIFDCITSFNQK